MSELCEYSLENMIIEKMEESLDDVKRYRNILINIKNLEQFGFERNKIIQGLFNIEDDIRETYQLAKSTLRINKEISEQLEDEVEKNKQSIARNHSLEKILENMQREFGKISSQLEFYKEKDADNLSYINDLERRIVKVDRKYENDYDYRADADAEINNNYINYASPPESDRRQAYINNNEFNNLNIVGEGKGKNISNNISNIASHNEKIKNNIIVSDKNTNNPIHNGDINNPNNIINERLNEKKVINAYFEENKNALREKANTCNTNKYIKHEESAEILETNRIDEEQAPYMKEEKPKITNTNKANRVVDIIMKLNSCDEINKIIKRLFGEEIEQQLSSGDVDENFLTRVEQSIKEVEQLKILEEKYDSQIAQNVEKKFHTEGNILHDDDYCNQSPSWTQTGNVGNIQPDFDRNKKSNTSLNRNKSLQNFNSSNEYSAYLRNLPIKNEIANEAKSFYRNTFSSRRFSPPKKFESFEDSHNNICRNRSKSKGKDKKENSNFLYPDLKYLNKVIAGKIQNRNEESNFENSLRNYLKKGVKKNKNIQSGMNNHSIPYRNIFDASLQKIGQTGAINMNNTNKSKSKHKMTSGDSY